MVFLRAMAWLYDVMQLYVLLFECFSDRSEWKQGLTAVTESLRCVPPDFQVGNARTLEVPAYRVVCPPPDPRRSVSGCHCTEQFVGNGLARPYFSSAGCTCYSVCVVGALLDCSAGRLVKRANSSAAPPLLPCTPIVFSFHHISYHFVHALPARKSSLRTGYQHPPGETYEGNVKAKQYYADTA